MTSQDLKKLIEREAQRRNWTPANFCKVSVGNHRLHKNLEAGGSCTLDTAANLKKWLEKNPTQPCPQHGFDETQTQGNEVADEPAQASKRAHSSAY